MSGLTTTRGRRLAPAALPLYPEPDRRGPDANTDTLQNVWGGCSSFCGTDGPPTTGAAVEDHGAWCASAAIGAAEGETRETGGEFVAYVELVREYQHGIYSREDVYGRRQDALVQLGLMGDGIEPGEGSECRLVVLTAGEARNLAAALIRAADGASLYSGDLHAAKQERQRA